jgi:hypothetical protein
MLVIAVGHDEPDRGPEGPVEAHSRALSWALKGRGRGPSKAHQGPVMVFWTPVRSMMKPGRNALAFVFWNPAGP